MVEFSIGDEDHERFERMASERHMTPNAALRLVPIKGMETYRPQQLAEVVDVYERLEERVEELRKDNDLPSRVCSQNAELKQLLDRRRLTVSIGGMSLLGWRLI